MKMPRELYRRLDAAVHSFDTKQRRAAYTDKGFSIARYRWDLFFQVIHTGELTYNDFADHELNDAHIYTALKRIVRDYD